MRCGEWMKVTGFLWLEIEEIKEKSRHQIRADGGDQKKHEENLTCENAKTRVRRAACAATFLRSRSGRSRAASGYQVPVWPGAFLDSR